jgi:hypothetical protein
METNDTGELYLKHKLRISNFDDPETYSPITYVEEPIVINDVTY